MHETKKKQKSARNPNKLTDSSLLAMSKESRETYPQSKKNPFPVDFNQSTRLGLDYSLDSERHNGEGESIRSEKKCYCCLGKEEIRWIGFSHRMGSKLIGLSIILWKLNRVNVFFIVWQTFFYWYIFFFYNEWSCRVYYQPINHKWNEPTNESHTKTMKHKVSYLFNVEKRQIFVVLRFKRDEMLQIIPCINILRDISFRIPQIIIINHNF